MIWSVIVTTAPRQQPTLQTCIDSLQVCGWKPIVLAEPDSPPSTAPTIYNFQKLGIWQNWVASVRLALKSDADVIMTVQDDTLFHPESKSFVESIMWPADNCGFISLYTPRHYSYEPTERGVATKNLRPVGVNRVYTRSLWGACALVFPRQVLETIIKANLIETWLGATPRSRNPAIFAKRKKDRSLIANSDTAIGKLMNLHNLSMWFVDPSPVQHIAQFSTIGHGDNTGNRNCLRPADHSLPLATQVFPCHQN